MMMYITTLNQRCKIVMLPKHTLLMIDNSYLWCILGEMDGVTVNHVKRIENNCISLIEFVDGVLINRHNGVYTNKGNE